MRSISGPQDIAQMQTDCVISIAALADAVRLSQTPCSRRVKKLENDGIIQGRALWLDARKLGLGVDVFAHIRLKTHDEAALVALECQTMTHPEIVECFSMSGESDYLMRVVAGSIDNYERFLKKLLLHAPGFASINSNFALQCIK